MSHEIRLGALSLEGNLTLPPHAKGVVLFAHGSGSSHLSPRNHYVASILNQSNIATLLIDLLTPKEEAFDEKTKALRFNIDLLSERLSLLTDWLLQNPRTASLPIGYFGSSTGAAAALVSAAHKKNILSAVVSRGGRADLAGSFLKQVLAPTLLIIGEEDPVVVKLNQQAYQELSCPKKMMVIPKATHLFEEPGCLEQVAHLACDWFLKYF